MAQVEKVKNNKIAQRDVPAKSVEAQMMVVRSRFVRVPPDKIRLVGNLILNKNLEGALNILQFTPKAGAASLILLVKSAISRAKDSGASELYIREIRVDEGPKLKRRRIIHRGRATAILKRMSHITIVLKEQLKEKGKSKKEKNGTQS